MRVRVITRFFDEELTVNKSYHWGDGALPSRNVLSMWFKYVDVATHQSITFSCKMLAYYYLTGAGR